jgi:thymidylate kinase
MDALESYRATDRAQPFAVICKRFDGSDRQYQRYADEQTAELVAKRLRELGLEARVECTAD